MSSPYMGITYSRILDNRLARWLWKKLMCPRHHHLFDEVWTVKSEDYPDNHYLYCDACGLYVYISRIELEKDDEECS